MKWAKSQIDMGRTVSIPEFAEFCNTKTVDDKIIIDMDLTHTFTDFYQIRFEVIFEVDVVNDLKNPDF